MAEAIGNTIRQSVREAAGLYHRLVLLVGETGSGKTAALRAASRELGAEVINVNLTLCAKLVELTQRQRIGQFSALFGDILNDAGPVVLLDNTEILFDRGLKQDPLRLLQGLSRKRGIVASWNGRLTGDTLTYAKAGHPEHRAYGRAEALIVDMNGASGHKARERRTA